MKQKSKKEKSISSISKPETELLRILETTSVQNIRSLKQNHDRLLQYYIEEYSSLAFSRSEIKDALQDSLRKCSSQNFEFSNWCRVVRIKWSLEPLSAKGSILDQAGGRFNIGDIDPDRFPRFPALYIAEDQATALQEVFGKESKTRLNRLETALANSDSFSLYRVKGSLENVLDLTDSKNLSLYFDLIKNIKLRSYVASTAKTIGLGKKRTVKTLGELYKTIFEKNWRIFPMQFDIPANSQILGQIAESAGIQGILYNSQKGMKRNLAIFPRSFGNSSAQVELMDEPPSGADVIRVLDQNNFKILV